MPIDLKFPTNPGLLSWVGFAFLACMVLDWVFDAENSSERIGPIWISMSLVEMQHLSINLFCVNLHRRQTQRSGSPMLNHEGPLVLPACLPALPIKVNRSWQAPEAQLHSLL